VPTVLVCLHDVPTVGTALRRFVWRGPSAWTGPLPTLRRSRAEGYRAPCVRGGMTMLSGEGARLRLFREDVCSEGTCARRHLLVEREQISLDALRNRNVDCVTRSEREIEPSKKCRCDHDIRSDNLRALSLSRRPRVEVGKQGACVFAADLSNADVAGYCGRKLCRGEVAYGRGFARMRLLGRSGRRW